MDTADEAEAMLLDPTLPEKQRARRRLVGAVALVAAAVVILPMVLDSHPNPVTSDIDISIPSPSDSGGDASDQADALDDAYAAPGVQMNASAVAGRPAPLPGASELSAVDGGASAAGTHSGNAGATGAGTGAGATGQNARTAATSPHGSQPAATSVSSAQHPTQTAQAAPSTRSSGAAANVATPAAASQPAQARNPGALAAGAAGQHAASAASSVGTLSSTAPATGAGAHTSPGARFAVQLGSLPSDAVAGNWVAKLKAVGVPAYVEHRKQPDGSIRVLLRAGPFADRDAAVAAIARVRGAGLLASRRGEETE